MESDGEHVVAGDGGEKERVKVTTAQLCPNITGRIQASEG